MSGLCPNNFIACHQRTGRKVRSDGDHPKNGVAATATHPAEVATVTGK
jgi:hypothetical protein